MPGPTLSATLPPRPYRTMLYQHVLIVAGLVCGAGLPGFGQTLPIQTLPDQTVSKLPPTPPTSSSTPSPLSPPIAASPLPADTAPRYRASVSYANGQLAVHADNSSLNQILRDISRQTGMKIVGGVAEQRVFGSYGPATAATVLQTLLNGTATNVLLQESLDHAPQQLMLTPQTGAATPPPPSSPIYNATETEPPLPGTAQPVTQAQTVTPATTVAPATATTSPSAPLPSSGVPGNADTVSPTISTAPSANSVPENSLPGPSTASTAPPSTATTNQSSPNGVKTPEQIYEELKLLQQKKANPQTNAQGSPAPK